MRTAETDAGSFVERAHELGLWMLPTGPAAVRAVFYLAIENADVDRARAIAAYAAKTARSRKPVVGKTAQSVSAY